MTVVYPFLEALPFAGSRGETLWKVRKEIRVKLAPRWYVQVPEGYVSNLGTIPRIPLVRWIVSPSDFPGPFVIHDFMCSEDHIDDGVDLDSGYTRWQADSTLYQLLIDYEPKIAWWKSWIIWFALRSYARLKGLK